MQGTVQVFSHSLSEFQVVIFIVISASNLAAPVGVPATASVGTASAVSSGRCHRGENDWFDIIPEMGVLILSVHRSLRVLVGPLAGLSKWWTFYSRSLLIMITKATAGQAVRGLRSEGGICAS